MDPALVASLLQGNNSAPQPNAPALSVQSFNSSLNPSYPQSNASSQSASNQSTPSPSTQQTPAPSTTTTSSPQDTTFNMNLGGPGGISMSSSSNGHHMKLRGPGGINISHGPNGNHTSLGGPSGINFKEGRLVMTAMMTTTTMVSVKSAPTTPPASSGPTTPSTECHSPVSPSTSTPTTIIPMVGTTSILSRTTVITATIGAQSTPLYGQITSARSMRTEWPRVSQRAMDEAFNTMSGMGMEPWGMGGWPRPQKHKEKRGSKEQK